MRPKGSVPFTLPRSATLLAIALTPVLLATPAQAATTAEWTDTNPPVLDQDYWFEAVDPVSADTAWAAGIAYGPELDDGVLMHWDGQTWDHDLLPGLQLTDIAALSADRVWAVGYDAAARRPVAVSGGAEWTVTPLLPPDDDTTRSGANGVAATAEDDVWVAGTVNAATADTAFVQRWDGTTWTDQELPLPEGAVASFLNAIESTPDGEVWAAGSVRFADGTTRAWLPRFDGTAWADTPVPAASAAVTGVFDIALDGDGAWAGGLYSDPDATADGALLLHWNGSTWVSIPTDVDNGLIEAVAPDGHGGAVLVGYDSQYQPLLLRCRDGAVTAEDSPVTGDLVRLMDTALSPDGERQWIVGDHKTPEFVKGAAVHAATATTEP